VAVLECGRRFADEDFARTTWDAAKYYVMPKLGMKGIFRLTLFKDIFVASGCGVGDGSLGYANTLYRARPAFYTDPQIAGLADWEAELAPHYDEAERMLGVVSYDQDTAGDLLLKEYARQHGFGDTYVKTPVGVYLGEEGKTVAATRPLPGRRSPRTPPSRPASSASILRRPARATYQRDGQRPRTTPLAAHLSPVTAAYVIRDRGPSGRGVTTAGGCWTTARGCERTA
jgi:hypothetical protein